MLGVRLAQAGQALPGVFLQKAQRHVECGTAPAFQREQLRQHARIVRRDGCHVVGTHAGGKQRLVRVAHGGVGQQHLRLVFHPLAEAFGSQLFEQVARALGNGRGQVARRFDGLGQGQLGQRAAFHFRVAVDGHFTQELQQPCGPVAPLHKVEQLGRVVDEARGAFARAEQRMGTTFSRNCRLVATPRMRNSRRHGPCARMASVGSYGPRP
jgi:hypothetical protein